MKYYIIVLIAILIGCKNDSTSFSYPTPINYEPIKTVEFCPNLPPVIGFVESGIYINNVLFAVYFDGTHTFLAQLIAGNFVTTDGRNCHFTIDSNFNVSYP